MENFESNFLQKQETIKTNRDVDWFSTLGETKTAKKRLYNPNLRTTESQEVWNKLPDFLEKNKELLGFYMGSKEVAAHLTGSMLLGVGTEGKKTISDYTHPVLDNTWHMWEIPPSDIDLLLFVGEKDDNERKYQNKHGAEDKELPDSLKEIERVDRFFEQSNFEEEFNLREEGMIVRIPELMTQIREICPRLLVEQKIINENRIAIYNAAMLYVSDALFQSNRSIEAKWRNEILKIILENPGGKILWDEGIRKYFNLYIAGYEDNPFTNKPKEMQKKRVGMAFEKILSEKNVPQPYKERAKDALSKQRANIQLPEFQVIQSLKDKIM